MERTGLIKLSSKPVLLFPYREKIIWVVTEVVTEVPWLFSRLVSEALSRHGNVLWPWTGCSSEIKYPVQLILLRCPREECSPLQELSDNTGGTPDVQCTGVALVEEYFGGPVPQGDHDRGELHLKVIRLGQTKVGQLELTLWGDEQVLWLQISMDDTVRVQEVDASE